jgi:hypothetical protein
MDDEQVDGMRRNENNQMGWMASGGMIWNDIN